MINKIDILSEEDKVYDLANIDLLGFNLHIENETLDMDKIQKIIYIFNVETDNVYEFSEQIIKQILSYNDNNNNVINILDDTQSQKINLNKFQIKEFQSILTTNNICL